MKRIGGKRLMKMTAPTAFHRQTITFTEVRCGNFFPSDSVQQHVVDPAASASRQLTKPAQR